jgi:hypothetical protein
MEKSWFKSMTFWGALGFGIVTVLEGLTGLWPEAAIVAQAIAGVLAVMGIRRAL